MAPFPFILGSAQISDQVVGKLAIGWKFKTSEMVLALSPMMISLDFCQRPVMHHMKVVY